MDSTLRLRNDLKEIARADRWLEDVCRERGVQESVLHDLRLGLDEAVSNVIRHGYGVDGSGEIQVRVDVEPGIVRIGVRDSAPAFNPLDYPEPELDIPIEERKRGGLGIFLYRRLMDRVDYSRQNGCNLLVLEKRT